MTARSSIVSSILSTKTKYLIDHREEPMLHIIEVEHNFETKVHSVTFFGKDGNIMYEAINTEEHPEWVVNILQDLPKSAVSKLLNYPKIYTGQK